VSNGSPVVKNGGRRDTTGEPPYPHDLIHVLIKTKDRIIEVCAPLYEKRLSLREVEEQTGISKFTILGTLSKHGTPIRNYVTGKNVPKDWTKTKHSGHPPFGRTYLDGNLVMDPKEHLISRRILRLHQSGKSNQSIADILNAKKIPTRKGGQWSRSVVRTIIIRENKLNT
jgi:hypothetical protein